MGRNTSHHHTVWPFDECCVAEGPRFQPSIYVSFIVLWLFAIIHTCRPFAVAQIRLFHFQILFNLELFLIFLHCCSSNINFFLEQQFMQMYAQIMSNYLHRKWAKKLTRKTKLNSLGNFHSSHWG